MNIIARAFSRTIDSVSGDDPRKAAEIVIQFREEIQKLQGKEIKKEA